jgi:hypothetical protein
MEEYTYSGGGGDDNYNGGRNGIPQNWNAGFHYSDKFNNAKNSFNSGYKYSKVIAPGITKTFSQPFYPIPHPGAVIAPLTIVLQQISMQLI